VSTVALNHEARTDTVGALAGALGLTAAVVATQWPGWVQMWTIAVGLYAIAKWLSWQPLRQAGGSPRETMAYFCAWPGLNARTFLQPGIPPAMPTRLEWTFAAAKLLLGVSLFTLGIRAAVFGQFLVSGWLGMAAIVFTLHFGLFHLLSCFWRSRGYGAAPIMDWPILAQSVSEFWGRRWNRPFRDGTHQFVFRPLIARFGLSAGTLLAFLFSGAIHELVITVPARGAWGQPTLFFLIQGAALQLERSRLGHYLRLGRGRTGWLFTVVVTVGPVGLLFPEPFVVDVIAPFLRAVGGVP
jgi:hypothetical protein